MDRYDVAPYEYFLKAGYLVVNREDTLVRTVLGNCVAVTIFDRVRRFGGINHFILPRTQRKERATAQYGNIAVPALLHHLLDLGADRSTIEAQILGGAYHPEVRDHDLGRKNVAVARALLDRLRIPVVSEDVGGRRGRKVLFHTGTNETAVIKVDRLRRSDWFSPRPVAAS
jgi:chemotaxis protein CheD